MKVHVTFCIHQKCDTFTVTIPGSLMKRCVSILRKKKRKYIDLQSSLSTIDTLISLAAFHTVINCHTKEEYMHEDTKSGCSLGTGNRRILPLLCRILRLMFGSLWLFIIQIWSLFQNNFFILLSNVIHLSPATRILNENPANFSYKRDHCFKGDCTELCQRGSDRAMWNVVK